MKFPTLLAVCLVTAGCVAADSASREPKVLIVGGNMHHDFDRWFGRTDPVTLKGVAAAEYTTNVASISEKLPKLDVLYLANNQPLPAPELRQGIFDLVGRGKGLLIVHAANWYSWNDWQDYNRKLVGGGTRSHDAFGEFEVKVEKPNHPVMKGVSPSFKIADELYRFEKDPQGSDIEVLATGINKDGKTYPVIWTTKAGKGRVLCMTLGHDDKAHLNSDFQKILKNGVKWAAGR